MDRAQALGAEAFIAAKCAGHGTRCECLSLAAAMCAAAESIPYSYCRHVLQARYRMECRHGDLVPAEKLPRTRERWPVEGPLRGVMAILLHDG